MVSIHSRQTVTIYVEGGGNGNQCLSSECRKAFHQFFVKAGFEKRLPKVIPCGRRNAAYDDFCTAVKLATRTGDIVFLLVDSEDPLQSALDKPWEHLLVRDKWEMPDGATNEQAHLMIECMENWFLADPETLQSFFGQGFHARSLPTNPNIDTITKSDTLRSLGKASQNTTKGKYGKGAHSFKILGLIDASKVIKASLSVQRLVNELNAVM